jgi:hypothetical protein
MNPAWSPSGIVLDLIVVLVVEIQPIEYEDDGGEEDDSRTSGKAGSWKIRSSYCRESCS